MAQKPLITCGIYLFDINTGKILICHATNSSWKTWSVPKGLKEEGEDEYIAAVRELNEETGIDVTDLNLIHITVLPHVKYKKQAKTLASYLLASNTNLQDHKFVCSTLTKNNFPEIDRWAWVEPEMLLLKVHESQVENLKEILTVINKFSNDTTTKKLS